MLFRRKSAQISVSDVEKYYDEWTDKYTEFGGELIEAFRTKDDQDVLEYYIDSARLENGQSIVDAGCGVCGASAYFAERLNLQIDALTISQIQVERSIENLEKKKLIGKVLVQKGDYHHLSNYFNNDYYDRVLFIESLGHSINPEKVIAESYKILKNGGYIYIKDFFKKVSNNSTFLNRCNYVVKNINSIYKYNTLDLEKTIANLRKVGFEIEIIKKPTFIDNVDVRLEFESKNNINIFGKEVPFVPTDWLELLCKK